MQSKSIRLSAFASKKLQGFQVLSDACVWMKAGVVSFHRCDNNFDCQTCAFDKGMQRSLAKAPGVMAQREPQWVFQLKQRYDGTQRPCRHVLTGRVQGPKICPYNYACYHCAFDQMLDAVDLADEAIRPSCRQVAGYQVADGCYYHSGHSWARFEHGGRVRMGLDDFIVKLFGVMDHVELPPLGEQLVQNEVGWLFGRSGRRAAVLAPLSGTVVAANHNVREHPQMIAEAPYDRGWLVIMEPQKPKKHLHQLYFGSESFHWIENEHRRLLELLGPPYIRLAAAGGQPLDDMVGTVAGIDWDTLVQRFLHTTRSA